MTKTASPAESIALEIHICDQRRSYLAHFEGPDAETMALQFIEPRGMTHAIYELESEPFDYYRYPKLYDFLYPTCEHGLSANLCAGPSHYPLDNPYDY